MIVFVALVAFCLGFLTPGLLASLAGSDGDRRQVDDLARRDRGRVDA